MTTKKPKAGWFEKMMQRWSDAFIPFMLGHIVALWSMLIVMFTINLIISMKP